MAEFIPKKLISSWIQNVHQQCGLIWNHQNKRVIFIKYEADEIIRAFAECGLNYAEYDFIDIDEFGRKTVNIEQALLMENICNQYRPRLIL